MYCKNAELRPGIKAELAESIIQKINKSLCMVAGAIMAPAGWQPQDAERTLTQAARALNLRGLTTAALDRSAPVTLRQGITEERAQATIQGRVSVRVLFVAGHIILPHDLDPAQRGAWIESARRTLEDMAMLAK